MTPLPRVRISDSFVLAVAERLAVHRPERGGAILGFGGTAHLLVEDDFGDYGAAHWDISEELSEAVGALELRGRGQLLGTVHTHPSGVSDPSGQDLRTMANAMRLNPHLDQLLICVVTEGRPRPTDLAIPGGHRMSVHVVKRAECELEFLRAQPILVPLREVLTGIDLSVVETISVTDTRNNKLDGVAPIVTTGRQEYLVAPIPATDDAWLMPPCLPGQNRPSAPRTANPDLEPAEKASLETINPDTEVTHTDIEPTTPDLEPVERCDDPTPLLATLSDRGMDLVPLDWGEGDLITQMRRITASRATSGGTGLERVHELVGSLSDRHILVAGAGSVGSRIAEDLVRSGVAQMTLIDPDTVSMPNMARSVYTRSDVGKPKVDALASRLSDINPTATVRHVAAALEDVDLPALLDGVDLVVLATDDMAQQSQLASLAYDRGIMHVSSALFRKAAAGEVCIVVPDAQTPCWACAVGTAALSLSERPDQNYGVNGRLVAESGLGASINLVASVASLATIGLLAGPDSHAGSSLARLIAERRTVGIIATTPGWGLFTELFDQLAHQSHPQSVWPRIQPVKGCPTCAPEIGADIMTGEQISLDELMAIEDSQPVDPVLEPAPGL